MKSELTSERLTTHSHRLVKFISYLVIVVVALRRRYDLAEGFSEVLAFGLLGLFTVLYASESMLSSRIKSYPRIYFALQVIVIQALGLFREYQDTWSLMYLALGFQVAMRFSRREAMIWFSLFVTLLVVTLSAEFGLVSGPGRALAYIVIGVLLISYDIQYAQHEDALEESQVFLAELQEAHQKLKGYASQAEELAALRQRGRMIQELYDSVGQKIFAIQLAAETTRLMLQKDPPRASEHIDDLQGQTQSALGQMRQLIDQWRPG